MNGRRYSEYFYNRISMAGVLLAILTLIVEIVLFVTELAFGIESPYFGMVTWLILPPFLVIGVVMIPAGALWTRRRLLRNPDAAVFKTLHIDLSNPTHRHTALALTIGGLTFLVLSSAGLYHTYHYTETVSFCGEVCHKVMNPEFTVYQSSAHAHVKCASCHIGAGASYFAKSKITGSYQIYSVLMEKYPRPIPTPVQNLRPAQETCEQCHWPQQFYSPKERTFSHFLSDEKNTPVPIRLMVNVGGGKIGMGQTGIHLHMNINNVIEYIAADTTRQTIAWVRSTNRTTGEVHEFRSAEHPLSDTEIASATDGQVPNSTGMSRIRPPSRIRRMDCLDCHNRPAHKFPSPQGAVNDALEAGTLDRTIPFIKREAVVAIDQPYQTSADAMAGIAGRINDFYLEKYPGFVKTDSQKITGAILAVQDIYRKSQFPEMRTNWKVHPDNIGHLNSDGCFRCHNNDLVSSKGKKMTRDCNTCHSFLKPEETKDGRRHYVTMEEFVHPGDVGDMWKETSCHECHQGGAELY